ncbi:hypothetical protein TNCV_4270221, partial [Trichonephila clavipes]
GWDRKNFDFDQSLDSEKSRPWRRRAAIFGNFVPPVVERPELQFQDITCEEDTSYVRATRELEKKGRIFPYFSKMYKNALKEDFIRVVEDLDGTVESTDTIAKLKTKIEKSSTFESDPDFVKTLIQNCIDEEGIAKRKRSNFRKTEN